MEDLALASNEIEARLEALESQIKHESDRRESLTVQIGQSEQSLRHLRELRSQFLAIRERLR